MTQNNIGTYCSNTSDSFYPMYGQGASRHPRSCVYACAWCRRSEGRYRYEREADGFQQWEYPAVASTDMEICTTPPHPGMEHKEEAPPLPAAEPPLTPPPPPPLARVATPPPPAWSEHPPAPPAWGDQAPAPPAPPVWGADPPPPGCDDLPPLPPEPKKQEIGDELMSFYNDIAELEKHTTPPPATPSLAPPSPERGQRAETERDRDMELAERERERPSKRKSKVKISTSMGMKHRTVSSMVAKWQQVADEVHSD